MVIYHQNQDTEEIVEELAEQLAEESARREVGTGFDMYILSG